jgi:DNA-binding LacI/PurR family transcriptional regulator
MASPPLTPERDRRTTLADVARAAGVSTALVSIVMRGVAGASPQTRERVLEAARDLGYRPDSRARLLRQSRSHLLGVMFGLVHPFHADLLEGIYGAAEAAGYDVVLSAVAPTRHEPRAVDTLLADRCEALILLGPESPASWLRQLATRLPLVVVARKVREPSVDVVRTADAVGISLAVDHLIELGHTAIAHIHGGSAAGAAERRSGYRAAMRRHGLEQQIRVIQGGPTEEGGAKGATEILASSPLPTAALAFNDRCATGVLDVFLRAGVTVPKDISVVGFDDTPLAAFSHIDLTTVRQDVGLMARLAVTRAVTRLTNQGETDPPAFGETVITPRLVVRGTTARPR